MAYRPFYRYGGHIELIGFKEYYGVPRGAWFWFDILLRALFPKDFLEYVCKGKKRPLCCIWGKNDHTIFFGGTLILLLQRAKALGYLDESTEPEGI